MKSVALATQDQPAAQDLASGQARTGLLEKALIEAIVGLAVNGKGGPVYIVPAHICRDGWRWTHARGRREAIETIRTAVKHAGLPGGAN